MVIQFLAISAIPNIFTVNRQKAIFLAVNRQRQPTPPPPPSVETLFQSMLTMASASLFVIEW